ncbi:hypothetical protein [Cellulomonas sp. WB94]|uniref:hypothetical protein n=1 Tax=Cellulomonas sp. WB94 TaxID=2173174 RepID=UPI0011B228F9|nr:hypothetical protein [Cellulomonas sp. WB94]
MDSYARYLRKPYKLGRQQHLGDFLDYLLEVGAVSSWHLRHEGPTAIWVVSEGGRPSREYTTRQAEALAEAIADNVQIYWRPVPSPGGENLYRAMRAQIAARRRKLAQEPLTHGPGALTPEGGHADSRSGLEEARRSDHGEEDVLGGVPPRCGRAVPLDADSDGRGDRG